MVLEAFEETLAHVINSPNILLGSLKWAGRPVVFIVINGPSHDFMSLIKTLFLNKDIKH